LKESTNECTASENIALELVINATKDLIRPIKKFTERARKTVFDESCLAI
jgi:hypothetical protein